MNRITLYLDKVGMAASTLCALHCAMLPLIFTILPIIGLSFLAEPWLEYTIIACSVFIGVLSLGLSYLKHRQKTLPLLFMLIGFNLILTGHLLEEAFLGNLLTALGGFIIVVAYYKNWNFTKHCKK